MGDVPIFERPFGHGFTIVVEGKPGPTRRTVGCSSFNYDPFQPSVRPDLQIIVSNPLGENPTAEVCDDTPPEIGGVPAAASFAETQPISDAINDLACRFIDGSGVPRCRRSPSEACTLFPDGEHRFAGQGSTAQFCGQIAKAFEFPVGDTVVTVRLRDAAGELSAPSSLIIRVPNP